MHTATDTGTIVLLKEKDAPELSALEAACFSTAWTEAQYAKLLRGIERLTAVHRSDKRALPPFLVWGIRTARNELAGYVSLGLHPSAGELEVYNIAVLAPFRRQGHAKNLIAHLFQESKRFNMQKIILEVRAGNVPALSLYASVGFRECGRRKNYYADTGEDALVLSCELTVD